MASITIRNLPDQVKKRLRLRAAEHGRSMEEEAREILRDSLQEASASPERTGTGLDVWNEIRAIVEPLGGIEFDIPPRGPMREPPDFNSPEYHRPDEE